jgi:hypothetical protein
MKTYTINQKQSNSGTIHDIASDQFNRVINFPKNAVYALVLPSYFGNQYTTAKTVEAIIAKSQKEPDGIIIDVDGKQYDVNGADLERVN